MAIPITYTQIKEHLDLSASMADLARRCPSVNLHNVFASFLSLPFDFLHEVSKGVVRDFTSPKALHTFEAQVFEVTDIKLSDKFQSEFPDDLHVG